MKPHVKYLAITIAALLLSALFCRADVTSYSESLKERDAVLSRIVAYYEARKASGFGDETVLESSKLALYAFRRDVAVSFDEKIKNQELIAGIYQKRLELEKVKQKTGVSVEIDILKATDSYLEAIQVLEELKLRIKKANQSPEPTS